MNRGNIIALFHALSGAGALVAGLLTKGGFEGPGDVFKPLGFAVFAVGMLLFAYTVIFLREAFLGNVEPVAENLVTDGPYQWVRHPLYLGMLITVIGLSIGMRSTWGLAIALGLFLPLTVLRARLEEASLRDKHGSEWEEYAARTHFLIPLIF